MNMWSVKTRPKASVSSAGGCVELLVLVIAIWVNVGLSYSGDTILPLPHLDVACVVLTDRPRLAGVSPWNRRPRHIASAVPLRSAPPLHIPRDSCADTAARTA